MDQDDLWEGARCEWSWRGLASRREAFHLGFTACEEDCRGNRFGARVSAGDSLLAAS